MDGRMRLGIRLLRLPLLANSWEMSGGGGQGKGGVCPTTSIRLVKGISLCSARARPCSRKGKGFAGMTLTGLSGIGPGKSTHGGHFPCVSYLKVINQANKPLNETCSVLLPC